MMRMELPDDPSRALEPSDLEIAELEAAALAPNGGMARNAGLLAMGSVGSRVLGLVRESIIAAAFGASGQVSAYRVAAQVPTLVYDLLVGGMLSAALVPVLSQTAAQGGSHRTEFTRLSRTLLGVFGAVLLVLTILLFALAPMLARLRNSVFGEGGVRSKAPSKVDLEAFNALSGPERAWGEQFIIQLIGDGDPRGIEAAAALHADWAVAALREVAKRRGKAGVAAKKALSDLGVSA